MVPRKETLIAIRVRECLIGRNSICEAIGIDVLQIARAACRWIGERATGDDIRNGNWFAVALAQQISSGTQGPKRSAVAQRGDSSQFPPSGNPTGGPQEPGRRRNLPQDIHHQVASDIEVGKPLKNSMIPPRDGGTHVAREVVAGKASRGGVLGLTPGKGTLHLQPMAHLLLNIHLESVVPGFTLPKGGLNQPRRTDVRI